MLKKGIQQLDRIAFTKPSAKKPPILDGFWSQAFIKGNQLTWKNGETMTLSNVTDTSWEMDLGTEHYLAELGGDGKLYWSDGDIWTQVVYEHHEQCPAGHRLQIFETQHDSTCHKCCANFPNQTTLYGCRPCKHNVCGDCLRIQKKDHVTTFTINIHASSPSDKAQDGETNKGRDPLPCHLDERRKEETLIIAEITVGGVLDIWNASASATSVVHPGDAIYKLNNERLTDSLFKSWFSNDHRFPPLPAEILCVHPLKVYVKVKAGDAVGVKLSDEFPHQGTHFGVMVVEIDDEGAIPGYNKANPSRAIEFRDRLVSVNGKLQPQEMLKLLGQEDGDRHVMFYVYPWLEFAEQCPQFASEDWRLPTVAELDVEDSTLS